VKTIQLEIEDNSLDMFLSLIGSFKEGIIKKFKIDDVDVRSDFEAVAKELESIKNKKYQPTNAREFLNDL